MCLFRRLISNGEPGKEENDGETREERIEKIKRDIEKEARSILIPKISGILDDLREKNPDRLMVTVGLRCTRCTDGELTIITSPKSDYKVIPCQSCKRELFDCVRLIAKEYGIIPLRIVYKWGTWIYPFSK